MAYKRYETKQQSDGRWSVYDTAASAPVLVNAFFTIDMSRERADDLVDLLNRQHSMQSAKIESR
jgi:hypothetical protein